MFRKISLSLVFVLLILIVSNSIGILKSVISPPQQQLADTQDIRIKAFELVDQALATRSKEVDFSFEGDFESPMRKLTTAPQERKPGMKIRPNAIRSDIFLKGILIKDDALAILGDAEGKTYICKQGDRILDLVIVGIGNDQVTVQNTDGSRVTLKVKEE
jgi:hypothetical protein